MRERGIGDPLPFPLPYSTSLETVTLLGWMKDLRYRGLKRQTAFGSLLQWSPRGWGSSEMGFQEF